MLDEQVHCMSTVGSYIPPLWIMCMESVAHMLVMLNSSSTFLIYCSVSGQFRNAMNRIWILVLNKQLRATPDNNHSIEQEIVALKEIGNSNIEIEEKDIVNLSVNNLVT